MLHTDLSRLIGVDIPMTFLVTVTLCFGARIVTDGRRSDYLFAGLFAGLATTTKLPAILLVVPLLVAHGYAIRRSDGGLRALVAKKDLWLAALLFAGVLFLTNPLFLVKLLGSIAWLLFPRAPEDMQNVIAAESGLELVGHERPNLYFYYLSAMRDSMGWPLFLLGIGGSILALWRHRPADVMLLSYAVIHYLAIASTSSETLYYPRYALPVIVVLAVLSGRMLTELLDRARWASIAVGIVVFLCISLPLAQSLDHAEALMHEDIRSVARQWFNSNVPAGSRVVIEGSKISVQRETVKLDESAEGLRRRIEYWRTREPKQAKYLEYQLAAHQGGGYDLVLIQDDSTTTLDEYLAQGVEYFVIRPRALTDLRKGNRQDLDLLESLRTDSRVELIRRFEGAEKERLASTIEIYQRRDAGPSPDPGP